MIDLIIISMFFATMLGIFLMGMVGLQYVAGMG